jgi:hypothetical protein
MLRASLGLAGGSPVGSRGRSRARSHGGITALASREGGSRQAKSLLCLLISYPFFSTSDRPYFPDVPYLGPPWHRARSCLALHQLPQLHRARGRATPSLRFRRAASRLTPSRTGFYCTPTPFLEAAYFCTFLQSSCRTGGSRSEEGS